MDHNARRHKRFRSSTGFVRPVPGRHRSGGLAHANETVAHPEPDLPLAAPQRLRYCHSMATHRLINTTWHNVLGMVAPALTIASGDVVTTETLDARGFDKNDVQRARGPNPMNGPIFVTGAEPGDALRVDILRMDPIRSTGWTISSLAQTSSIRRLLAGCRHGTKSPGGSTRNRELWRCRSRRRALKASFCRSSL